MHLPVIYKENRHSFENEKNGYLAKIEVLEAKLKNLNEENSKLS